MTTEAPGKKKMMRVALSVTGATAAGVGLMTPTPAKAATVYYQIVVETSFLVNRMQICGYNQNNAWVCTGDSIPHASYKGNKYFYMKNWWWNGYTKLWWDNHGAGSWDQCYVPQNAALISSNGFIITGRKALLVAGPGRPTC